jgi:NitT/TauT family transport system ATP-binding protein
MPELVAEHIGMVYPSRHGSVEAIRDISLKVRSGEFVAVLGPSGCGKSTFLRLVASLAKPTSGRVLIDGQPIDQPGRDRGMVFQDDSLLPWRTVLDNAVLGLQVAGVKRATQLEIAREYIDLVGLSGFERHFPSELSGGMRQRVNLCRALAVNPAVLLMDEPFASLDAQTREAMQSELLRVWRTSQKTVLFITHQIDEAVFLADRVIILSSRPAVVRAEFEISIPRPRDLSVKRTPEFIRYMDTIWGLLEKDIQEAAAR